MKTLKSQILIINCLFPENFYNLIEKIFIAKNYNIFSSFSEKDIKILLDENNNLKFIIKNKIIEIFNWFH